MCKVLVNCYKCGAPCTIVYIELVRTVNRQSKYTTNYHCPKCYRNLEQYKSDKAKKASISLAATKKYRSEVSKKLWDNKGYREKCEANIRKLSGSKEFAVKVSAAIKHKFATDYEYVAKVNAARFNDTSKFLERCSDIHDGFYDYSRVVYKRIDIGITIICPIHGEFTQLPSNHIKGHGCNACAVEASKLSQDEFLNRCLIIHGSKYDYSQTEYNGSLSYINYNCEKHGNIRQLAQNHLNGKGCRYCSAESSTSSAEDDIANYVGKLCDIIRNDRKCGTEFDILVPSKNLAIEHHGLYWHSYNHVETNKQKYRHYNKATIAEQSGLRLVQIYESEWIRKRPIVESMLAIRLGYANKIGARDCYIQTLSTKDAQIFFDNNHLLGARHASFCIGLILNNEIISAVSFNNTNNGLELIRFASKQHCIVVGGLSRLMCYVFRHNGAKSIFTFADRRYSTAAAYNTVGFKHIGITPPGYLYCMGLKTYSRYQFQKHKLSFKFDNFNQNLTEAQNMFANGYRRIWDAGHHKLVLYEN